MSVDLSHKELVYLLLLVNSDFCEKQHRTQQPTPFEASVFEKLDAERNRQEQNGEPSQ